MQFSVFFVIMSNSLSHLFRMIISQIKIFCLMSVVEWIVGGKYLQSEVSELNLQSIQITLLVRTLIMRLR